MTLEEAKKLRDSVVPGATNISGENTELARDAFKLLNALIEQLEWREKLKGKVEGLRADHIARNINMTHEENETYECLECMEDDIENKMINAILSLLNE